MEIHIKTDGSDKRLLWISLGLVGLVLAWNLATASTWYPFRARVPPRFQPSEKRQRSPSRHFARRGRPKVKKSAPGLPRSTKPVPPHCQQSRSPVPLQAEHVSSPPQLHSIFPALRNLNLSFGLLQTLHGA